MLLYASTFNCISLNNSGNLHCTVYRMNDCKEGMLRLRSVDHTIAHMHRVLGLPKFAN
jgi:hypothetical protein